MGIKELKESMKKITKTTEPLFAVVIGSSAAGKSYLAGTTGLPTLYLYLKTENHGPKAASSTNPDIYPVCLDIKEEQDDSIMSIKEVAVGTALTPDQTLIKLKYWGDIKLKSEGIGTVVVDSISDLESVIKETNVFKQACLSANGKHNSYNEGPAFIKIFRDIVLGFLHHTDEGVNVVMTLAGVTQATDEHGASHIIQPKLATFGASDLIARLFPDVLLVSRVSWEGETKFALIFNGNFERKSKDMAGRVLKTLNFGPRLTGLSIEQLPDMMKANLQDVIKLKSSNPAGNI